MNKSVKITINNKVYEATKGRSVALELFTKNFYHLRTSPKFKNRRGFFLHDWFMSGMLNLNK